MQQGHLIMVTGGSRSGKSRLAEELANNAGGEVVYLATAIVNDAEMAARVKKHQERRPADWRTVEVPYSVTEAIAKEGQQATTLLMDSLGAWLSNLLSQENGYENWDKSEAVMATIMNKVREMVRVAADVKAQVIIVTEEIGMGMVPLSPLGRVFCDLLGLANQVLASQADQVYLVVAGLPLALKGKRTTPGHSSGPLGYLQF